MKRIDLTGRRFGRLVVVKLSSKRGSRNALLWECICDCGNIVYTKTEYLNVGDTKSCGCLRISTIKNLRLSHGMSGTPFYEIWKGVKSRCNNVGNSSYVFYGAKGISYSKEWNLFKNFKYDMYDSYLKHLELFGKENTSIERIDSKNDYSKENCRWATNIEQSNNTERNVFITFDGQTKTSVNWDRYFGFNRSTINCRIKRGWSIERALTTPVLKFKRT